MMPVIEFNFVSKKFCSRLEQQMFYGAEDIFRNMLSFPSKSAVLRPHEFWAVNNVSFSIQKGERIGIFGPNGSGKSTLLKMMNGIFMPDIGEIRIKGTVGALIEVGAGFHPYLTGKENIYLNGAILGRSKKEIDQKFEEIVEFSGVRDFLNMPVKNYSSGMYVRLGFSIAVHLVSDILLIDEVLAVGDQAFQDRCMRKIEEIKAAQTTIVFVSHNKNLLKFVTDKTFLIQNGKLINIVNSNDL